MKKIFFISILFYVAIINGFVYAEEIKAEAAPKVMSKSETELRSSMKTLWESRATLLRAYIVSEMSDSKDIDEARDKLLKRSRSSWKMGKHIVRICKNKCFTNKNYYVLH